MVNLISESSVDSIEAYAYGTSKYLVSDKVQM